MRSSLLGFSPGDWLSSRHIDCGSAFEEKVVTSCIGHLSVIFPWSYISANSFVVCWTQPGVSPQLELELAVAKFLAHTRGCVGSFVTLRSITTALWVTHVYDMKIPSGDWKDKTSKWSHLNIWAWKAVAFVYFPFYVPWRAVEFPHSASCVRWCINQLLPVSEPIRYHTQHSTAISWCWREELSTMKVVCSAKIDALLYMFCTAFGESKR